MTYSTKATAPANRPGVPTGAARRRRPGIAWALAGFCAAVLTLQAPVALASRPHGLESPELSAPAPQPQLAANRRGEAPEPPRRGSSAQLEGGSSADRYGGTSADRGGIAGERDPRHTARRQGFKIGSSQGDGHKRNDEDREEDQDNEGE